MEQDKTATLIFELNKTMSELHRTTFRNPLHRSYL